MSKILVIQYGEPDKMVDLFNGEVGPISWTEDGVGGITVTASPIGTPLETRRQNGQTRGNGLAGAVMSALASAPKKGNNGHAEGASDAV